MLLHWDSNWNSFEVVSFNIFLSGILFCLQLSNCEILYIGERSKNTKKKIDINQNMALFDPNSKKYRGCCCHVKTCVMVWLCIEMAFIVLGLISGKCQKIVFFCALLDRRFWDYRISSIRTPTPTPLRCPPPPPPIVAGRRTLRNNRIPGGSNRGNKVVRYDWELLRILHMALHVFEVMSSM